jgi:hypothetical protein
VKAVKRRLLPELNLEDEKLATILIELANPFSMLCLAPIEAFLSIYLPSLTQTVITSESEARLRYFITAGEIFNIQLNADLVTLRACSSGRSNIVSGDELIGLTRAFLYAGTPSLLAAPSNATPPPLASLPAPYCKSAFRRTVRK